MAKKYQIVFINKETNKRHITYQSWTSKKKATQFAAEFAAALKKPIGDFEIIEAVR